MRSFAAVLKDSPDAGDAHVPNASADGKRKAKPFKAVMGTISPNAKLPVTGMTAAAMAEQGGASGGGPVGKAGARHSRRDIADLQKIHDHAVSLGAKCPEASAAAGGDGVITVKRDGQWAAQVKIAKTDADKNLVFGWANVVEKGGKTVLDSQGDTIDIAELEDAVYAYVLDKREAGEMHDKVVGIGKLVESVVLTAEKCAAMGITALDHVGWWVGYKVAPEVFAKVKSGEYSMLSIGGSARRVPI